MKTDEGSSVEVEHTSNDRRFSAISLAPFNDGTIATEVVRTLPLNLGTEFVDLNQDVKEATAAEHAMSVRAALRMYPKAVIFSMILSLTLVMEGYDTALLGAFYALPQFQEKYGKRLADGNYQVTAEWQSGVNNGGAVGSLLGLFISGIIYERYGYRKTLLAALTMLILCIFVQFFAVNIQMLLVGQVLCGICWGTFQTQTTTYAADVTPVVLRVYLTSYVNLCWIIGQFISAGVIRSLISENSEWSFRLPFAVQWVWPVPIIIGVLLAPESPWWLVRKGRIAEAKASLLRLTTKDNINFNVDQTVALMIHTNEVEKEITSGPGTSYWDCFKGTDLRRTEIVCCVWMIQIFCGQPFGGVGAYFFEAAGFPPEQSFSLQLGATGIAFVGAIISWFLMRIVGRRTLYIYGLAAMLLILLAIGILGIPQDVAGLSWTTGALMFLFVFIFEITVGPVCYSLVAEIPATRLRNKSVILARCSYNIAGILGNIINPRMLNPSAWNLKGKAGFVWAVTCLLSLVWSVFRLPEPKGLTYCELDILFENKASARKFRRFRVILEESGYFCVTTPSVATTSGSTTT